ncbi:tRNA (N(6)-L-threonylcarbamoyladenosine(37)-C(2))-methylthiotransferase MtaB [Sedimenticola hydrogenitrophicus]|uniref:tRNA (N(6)-L-threonylcarbamoyladenosine(37)-C(2))- methylthiotransferase MtaB n=1 Tax=Sedimenticola hydrogenitrophicus TaxID=2967975 RepID=UPI0023B1DAD7|nr:tRNA (N(6)-L-threonylcarbamoyladenosine(37)-C(2))-methylthiotransferase MtaB [Sedimenticola hydrogenitrophicus]
MRIHLKTLGCRLNEAELESWSRDFETRGHQITPRLADADLVVVNTCAVTGEAVRKSRKLLSRARRRNPRAKLVVSGCYATLDPAESTQSLGVDLVVDNRDKERLVEITSRELDLHAMPQQATAPGESGLLGHGRQRAFVKIQDGCRYQCTFCIVTVARGAERSVPVDQVVAEINEQVRQGIHEVVLTGVHIGGYGSDNGSDLYQLIRAVLERTRIPRLRLGAVEPWDLPENFWDLFANPRLMPHLHLPIQSGSDSVLKRMARRCKSGEFQRLAEQARQRVPDLNLTTDIIVGFPGENNREWQQTLALVERIGFGHLHIFAYSPRPGTRAAELPNPVPRELIRQRSETLHQLGEQLNRETLERFVGRRFPVLVESAPTDTTAGWSGYTPNFLRVNIAQSPGDNLENRIVEAQLQRLADAGDALTATLVQ